MSTNITLIDIGDIALHFHNITLDDLYAFLDAHWDTLIQFDEENRVIYGVYLRGWYATRGITMDVVPTRRVGRLDRWMIRWLIRIIGWRWDGESGFAAQWIRENIRSE